MCRENNQQGEKMYDNDGSESEAQEIDFDVADEGYQMSDVEADADTLASAGMGTDEDYGYYGNDEGF